MVKGVRFTRCVGLQDRAGSHLHRRIGHERNSGRSRVSPVVGSASQGGTMATDWCGRKFVSEIRPFLETCEADSLIGHLRKYWPNKLLRDLLFCGDDETVKVALLCLSLTGTMEDTPGIASLLPLADAFTRNLVEHALWSIWFRASDDKANIALHRAVQLIGENRSNEALARLSDLLDSHPGFAEAHNQRAIIYFLQGDYESAKQGFSETLRLNPCHYAALACLGHCHATLAHLHTALALYRKAHRLHPHAEGLREMIEEVTKCLARSPSYGGSAR